MWFASAVRSVPITPVRTRAHALMHTRAWRQSTRPRERELSAASCAAQPPRDGGGGGTGERGRRCAAPVPCGQGMASFQPFRDPIRLHTIRRCSRDTVCSRRRYLAILLTAPTCRSNAAQPPRTDAKADANKTPQSTARLAHPRSLHPCLRIAHAGPSFGVFPPRCRSIDRRPPAPMQTKLKLTPRPCPRHAVPSPRPAFKPTLALQRGSMRAHAHTLLALEDATHAQPTGMMRPMPCQLQGGCSDMVC